MMMGKVLMNVPDLLTDHYRREVGSLVRPGVDVPACLSPDHTCTYLKWSGFWTVVGSWV
jgi:hypothetical protein